MDRDTIRLECLKLAINRGSNVAEVVANAKILEAYLTEDGSETNMKPAKSGKAGNSETLQSRTTTRKD